MPSKGYEKTLEQRLFRNRLKQCFTDGCRNNRHGLSRFCGMCKYRRYFYGWSGGRKIWPREYAQEKRLVEQAIERNRNAKSIKLALSILEEWLGRRYDLVTGLREAGVTPERVLIESASLYLFAHRNPRLVPGWTAIKYAIGLNVIRLHKAKRRIYGKDNVAVGNFILNKLKPLFMRMCDSVERQEREQRMVDTILEEELA